MAKRPVKVSGYVRTRRKGKSVVTTMVRGYERKRPELPTITVGSPEGTPPQRDGGTPIEVIHRDYALPAPERRVVEGVIEGVGDFDTVYDVPSVARPAWPEEDQRRWDVRAPLQHFLQRFEGRRVRFTIELLDSPADA